MGDSEQSSEQTFGRGPGYLGAGALRRLRDAPVVVRDPGSPVPAVAVTGDGGPDAILASRYDHDMLHRSNKALGTGQRGGHPEACDRGGGKCALCALTRGSWCEEFFRQERVPWKPAPRGSRDCPSTQWGPCNGVGNCHYDIGVCQCPAGWKGEACDVKDLRPCTHRHRTFEDPVDVVIGHVDAEGKDLDLTEPGWTASRCAGQCDVDRAACWCPANTKYGRKPPPADAPPWVRFSARGRAISTVCKPGKVPHRNGSLVPVHWGDPALSLDDIIGPNGWCNADTESDLTTPARNGCHCDGEPSLIGRMCEEVLEEACPNQCSGHGECDAGYCRCHPGWYGQECARKKAGEEMEPGLDVTQRPWLQTTLRPVPAAATQPPSDSPGPGAGGNTSAATSSGGQGNGDGEEEGAEGGASTGDGTARGSRRRGRREGGGRSGSGGRLRPLIYVYDMPPEFTTRMHQYRMTTLNCHYRQYARGNETKLGIGGYSIEAYLHEMLLLSPHRTFDPEEADFFYVPVYFTCWTWPINGWADAPFWGAPTCQNRYSNAAHMWLAAKRWIQAHFPYWDRRGGRDHIFLTNHDEGACFMPTEIYETAIMLTHWGRLDINHTSNTAWIPDNYTVGFTWPGVLGGADVRTLYDGHRCYDPRKDLVIPGLKAPDHYAASPLLGAAPYHRDILLYLRGDIGRHRAPNYSRGIRQKLYSMATTGRWAETHRIFVGDTAEIPGNYSEHLARSVFCAVVPGDGYAMRMEDAVLHGCLPLIIMDRTHALFESILDLDSFSLRIEEAAVNDHLPNLLKAISKGQIERMQRRLALVWHRFAYAQGATVRAAVRGIQGAHANTQATVQGLVPELHPFQPVTRFPVQVDALSTIIQWLYGRIPHTRGEAGAATAGAGPAAATTAADTQRAAG